MRNKNDSEIRKELLQEIRREKGIPNWMPKLLNGREEWERRLKERKERDGRTPKPLITFRSDMGCQLRLEMRER
jgi:hypothetical protein